MEPESKTLRKEIKKTIRNKPFNEAIPTLEEFFKTKKIHAYFTTCISPKSKMIDIDISSRTYSFSCTIKHFLFLKWWKVKLA